jgi:hypothetical protein
MLGAAVFAAFPASAAMEAGGCVSRYGGPCYQGKPALTVTSSLLKAGGGAGHFSTVKALTAMVGPRLVKAETAKLTKQYGKARVARWVKLGDYAVADAVRIATKAGVKLPKPTLSGKPLASALVNAGLDTHSTFYIEFLLDKALSHKIHDQLMDDMDKKFGATADADYHRISTQAFADVAHALGRKTVRVAAFH